MSQRKESESVVEYQGYENGPLLRQIRKERGFTIEKVCELAGISTSTLSQLEQGGRNLTMRNLYHLMRIYNVDANTLLGVPKMVAANSVDESLKMLSFYRIPKLLFTDDYFKELSTDAKVLYGLLLDRMSISVKNNCHGRSLCIAPSRLQADSLEWG